MSATEAKLAFVTVQGTDMIITGANLHLRNGLDATNGYPTEPISIDPTKTRVNGLGNLIIGYDASNGGFENRSGCANLILGDFSSYSSFAGIVGGLSNTSSGPYGIRPSRDVIIRRLGPTVPLSADTGTGRPTTASVPAFLAARTTRAGTIDTAILGGEGNTITTALRDHRRWLQLTVGTEYGFAAGFPGFGPNFSGWFSSP